MGSHPYIATWSNQGLRSWFDVCPMWGGDVGRSEPLKEALRQVDWTERSFGWFYWSRTVAVWGFFFLLSFSCSFVDDFVSQNPKLFWEKESHLSTKDKQMSKVCVYDLLRNKTLTLSLFWKLQNMLMFWLDKVRMSSSIMVVLSSKLQKSIHGRFNAFFVCWKPTWMHLVMPLLSVLNLGRWSCEQKKKVLSFFLALRFG